MSQGTETPSAFSKESSVWEVFISFLKLGLTSFGGPIAHLGYFREEFVNRRKWLSDSYYADLVALCQFLPGPASSQVGFALGYLRSGLGGAFAAWFAFTMPSAVFMIACAYSLAYIDPAAPWVQGLKVAAVAVVAHAIWGMAVKLCPDRTRVTMALGAASILLLVGSAWAQVGVIALGMFVGIILFRRKSTDSNGVAPVADNFGHIRKGNFARSCLVAFFVLLVGLPLLAGLFNSPWLNLVDGFYRAGSLVFGGGHVVLPLLEAETVGRGWLSQDEFLAGYGAAQAVPGPLFTFAAYLGALIAPWGPAWLGGLLCLVAILIPSMLLVLGALPHWHQLRANPLARSALMGANAAVVGLLIAAFYNPIWLAGITSAQAFMIGILAFGLLQYWKAPAWLVVLFGGLAGQFLL